MALAFQDVGYSYGGTDVLAGVDLRAAPGAVTCLLGESGSGKTTLLRLAAGVLPMQSGEIVLDGAPLATRAKSPPPERRPVGLLFQEGALFPHMTVANNVAYGLDDQRGAGSLVADLLEQVGLPGYGDRYPHTLSGGQAQRVALARAMAPNPRVLLMDEPFASIDVVRRRNLREAVRRVLASHDCITILVTHDPLEAMAMSDHIAVMEGGRIVQADTPAGLYDRPRTLSVARMIGGGTELAGTVENGRVRTAFGRWAVDEGSAENGPVRVIVREAPISLHPDPDGATVLDRRVLGPELMLVLAAPSGERLTVLKPRGEAVPDADRLAVTPDPAAIHVFAEPASHS